MKMTLFGIFGKKKGPQLNMPDEQIRLQRMKYFGRIHECAAVPIDIVGDTGPSIVAQMTPDDWHEIALRWNWDVPPDALEYIIEQPQCDVATAVVTIFKGRAVEFIDLPASYNISMPKVFTMAAENINSNFYANHELDFGTDEYDLHQWKTDFDELIATGKYPWMFSHNLLDRKSKVHNPKYTVQDGHFIYDYKYWLENLAPPLP
jgi:Domain of unknown function (DUF4274)